MSFELRAARERRVELMDGARAIIETADGRSTRPSASELRKFDERMAEIARLDQEIERLESQQRHDIHTLSSRETTPNGMTPSDRNRGFNTWCRVGTSLPVSDAGLDLARKAGFSPHETGLTFDLEERAMGVTVSGGGDKAFARGFTPSLERALKSFGSVRNVARVVKTATGAPLPFPTSNDTGNVGALLAENSAVSAQDIAISETVLDAYKYSSKLVLVSVELLQDESVDLEEHIGSMLGERLGRITNTHFTTGTGSSQPNGVVTASTAGKTAAATGAVTYAELVDLMTSVDPAYQPNATWMFNFSTLAALMKLVDGDGRPLWQPSMTSGFVNGAPGQILGRPFIINQDMASLGASAKTILYGDFSKYVVREAKTVELLKLTELYAASHQVGFFAYMRTDGDLLDAGTHPIKHLVMAAS